jgi:hypothetical protein
MAMVGYAFYILTGPLKSLHVGVNSGILVLGLHFRYLVPNGVLNHMPEPCVSAVQSTDVNVNTTQKGFRHALDGNVYLNF